MWFNDWDVEAARRTRQEFLDKQKWLHEEKLAMNKAKREAARKAAKIVPEVDYPWLKKDGS